MNTETPRAPTGTSRGAPAAEQIWLPGFSPPDIQEINWFFALMPAPTAIEQIESRRREVCEAHKLEGKPMRPERLHVSLHNIGDRRLKLTLVEIAKFAAARAAHGTPAFDLSFDRIARFGGQRHGRALALSTTQRHKGLEALSWNLATTLAEYGFPDRSGEKLNAHVTTHYGDTPAAPIEVAPVSWQVEEFVLLESIVGKSIYHEHGRWRLGG